MDIYTALFDQNEVNRRTNLEYWNEGRNEGREEGEKKGREEGKEEVARAMKQQQIPIETISLCTGLTIAKIEEL